MSGLGSETPYGKDRIAEFVRFLKHNLPVSESHTLARLSEPESDGCGVQAHTEREFWSSTRWFGAR